MGADFIFAIAKYPEDPDVLKQQIDELSHERLAWAADASWGEVPEDDAPESEWDEIRDLLKTGVDEVLLGDRRDTGQVTIPDAGTFVISGGMTWGDDPTEACRFIWALEAAGLA